MLYITKCSLFALVACDFCSCSCCPVKCLLPCPVNHAADPALAQTATSFRRRRLPLREDPTMHLCVYVCSGYVLGPSHYSLNLFAKCAEPTVLVA